MSNVLIKENWNATRRNRDYLGYGSKAYEALTKLRNSYAADDIYQAGVVERTADGRVLLQDGGSNTAGANTLGGSLIGSLIGILGGPLGVLLGFSSGALLGSLVDLGDATDDDDVMTAISKQLLPGTTSLIVDLNETSPQVVDDLAASSGGNLLRYNYDDMLADVLNAEAAAKAASAEAKRVLREQKHDERKADLEKRWDEFKTKFKNAFS